MALPVTLTSRPFQYGFPGPFKAPNQQIYVVTRDAAGEIHVMMATDPTSSFADQDDSNNPAETLVVWVAAYLSGSEIHIVSHAPTTGDRDILYHVFDTSTDTWTTTDETIEAGIKDIDANAGNCSVAVRSDGDVIVLYTGDPDNDMGNPFERVDYARKEGGSWTTGIDVGGTSPAAEDRLPGVLVRGSADNMHFFWINQDVTSEHQARSLDSANSLSTARTLDLQSTTALNHRAWAPGFAWDDAGTWRVVVPTCDLDNDELVLVRWTESSGALAASPGTTVVGSPADVQTQGVVEACAVVDGDGRAWVMWAGGGAGGADRDIYRDDAAPPYTTWSGETEEEDAVTAIQLACNIYPRDSAIKLAFVYTSGADGVYDEVSITAPTAPTMANSRFPDQNYKIGPFSI